MKGKMTLVNVQRETRPLNFGSYSARPGVQIDNALSSFQQVFNFDPGPHDNTHDTIWYIWF